MSRLAVESQTISIHGASEFGYNPDHTVDFFPGGIGGNGGAGGVSGGGGGEGEGPRTSLRYDITTESFTLTNNLTSTTIEQPRSDFRSVNLGDLILYDEIDRQNVVDYVPIHRRRTGVVIRHIKVVVATQRRKAQVLEAQRYRHPLLAQLFGFTCSAGINALIYHDGRHGDNFSNPENACPIHLGLNWQHFEAAELYWKETTGNNVNDLPGTGWIRLSTGKLCLDIGDGVKPCSTVWYNLRRYYTSVESPSFKLTEDELHTKLFCALNFAEFYVMVASSAHGSFVYDLPSSTESITLPSIWISGDWADFKSDQLLANPFPNHVTPNDIYVWPWGDYPLQNDEGMPTGWIRIEFHAASDIEEWWLSQQAYVHKHLQGAIVANVPLYFITGIRFDCILAHQLDGFTLQGTFMTDAPSNKVEVLDGQLAVINPPDAEKYYWAFDPAGLDQLTHEIAEDIGLPTPKFTIEPWGLSLEEEETNLIREFHAAKGFDPESRDVAIAM
ncbi:hypothetical protein B0H14DRAFT_2601131 [Mycena olivaceomarginata]|nr:hypothetical protein B0H14DRAFT_2601131 [Mycena olivaceomarginata]